MNGVYMPLQLQARYCPGGPSSCPAGPTSIKLHDILFQNVTGTGRSPLVGTFVCDAHAPCHNVRLDHVVLAPEAQAGEAAAAAARFACQVIPTPLHVLGRISPIFPPFFPIFCAFSPS